jgi:intracellular septation protein A
MTETPIDDQFAGAPPISVTRILRESGPRLVRDSLGPVLAFYIGFKLVGLLLGIALGCVVGVGLYLHETRRGRTGVLARLSLGFVLLQAAVGFISRSATIYFLQPVILDVALASIFIGSVAISRPVIGASAKDTYPFPLQVAGSATFRRVFGRLSLVWGVYFLLRAGVRLVALRTGHIDTILVVNTVSDFPFVIGLIAYSTWYGVYGFKDSQEWGPMIAMVETVRAALAETTEN